MFAVLNRSYAAQLAFGANGFGSGTCASAGVAPTTAPTQAMRARRAIVARGSGCDIPQISFERTPAESRLATRTQPSGRQVGGDSAGPRANTMHATRDAREMLGNGGPEA